MRRMEIRVLSEVWEYWERAGESSGGLSPSAVAGQTLAKISANPELLDMIRAYSTEKRTGIINNAYSHYISHDHSLSQNCDNGQKNTAEKACANRTQRAPSLDESISNVAKRLISIYPHSWDQETRRYRIPGRKQIEGELRKLARNKVDLGAIVEASKREAEDPLGRWQCGLARWLAEGIWETPPKKRLSPEEIEKERTRLRLIQEEKRRKQVESDLEAQKRRLREGRPTKQDLEEIEFRKQLERRFNLKPRRRYD